MSCYKYLPNRCELKIKLTRSSDEFLLEAKPVVATTAGQTPPQTTYRVVIVDLRLHVYKIFLDQNLFQEHFDNFKLKKVATFPITRTRLINLNIPKNSQNVSFHQVSNGALPKSVVIGFIGDEAFNGDINKNPFYFHHFGLETVKIYRNGYEYPAIPINYNFKDGTEEDNIRGYRHFLNEIGFSNIGRSNAITYDKWCKDGFTFFSFDFTQDKCNGFHYHKLGNGNIDLNLRFSEALSDTIHALVYFSYDNNVMIDADRNVTTDRTI